jgi:hypothetical protein
LFEEAMSERAAPERIWSGIDIFKVAAGTLAAVAAAVIGSFLGVAGTLIGAAVASVVGSIGTEVFQKSLNQGYARLRGTRPGGETAGTPLAAAATPADAAIPVHGEPATHAVPVTGAPHLPAVESPARPRWRRVVVAAGAFFVLAMGGIFAVEAVAGEPLAALVGSSDLKGTSISPQQGPAGGSSPAPSESASPDESTAPSTDEPSSDPTVIPTIPPSIEGPSTAPDPTTTTQAPEPTGDTSTGDGSGGDGSTGDGSGGDGSGGSAREGSTDLVPDGTP